MPIGINTAEKLIKQTSKFDSSHTKGLQMINERYFTKSKGVSLSPDIESQKIKLGHKTISEFSTKKFKNGDKFEVYRLPEHIIKVLKNRFGEIKKFSNSNKNDTGKSETILEQVKTLFAEKIQEFLG